MFIYFSSEGSSLISLPFAPYFVVYCFCSCDVRSDLVYIDVCSDLVFGDVCATKNHLCGAASINTVAQIQPPQYQCCHPEKEDRS